LGQEHLNGHFKEGEDSCIDTVFLINLRQRSLSLQFKLQEKTVDKLCIRQSRRTAFGVDARLGALH